MTGGGARPQVGRDRRLPGPTTRDECHSGTELPSLPSRPGLPFSRPNDRVSAYIPHDGFGAGGDEVLYQQLRKDCCGSELFLPDHLLYRPDEENPGRRARQSKCC